MKSLTFSSLICALDLFCSIVAQKGKICSRLLYNRKMLLKSCRPQSGKAYSTHLPIKILKESPSPGSVRDIWYLFFF